MMPSVSSPSGLSSPWSLGAASLVPCPQGASVSSRGDLFALPPLDQVPHLVHRLTQAGGVALGPRLLHPAPGAPELAPELWSAPVLEVVPGLLDQHVDGRYGLAVVGYLGVVDKAVEVFEEL